MNDKEMQSDDEDFIDATLMPEHRLLASLIRRAYIDYCYPERSLLARDSDALHEQKKAALWLFGPELVPAKPFSFTWVCEHLFADSEPEEIKQIIRSRIKKEAKEKLKPEDTTRIAA